MERISKDWWPTDIISPFNFVSDNYTVSEKYGLFHATCCSVYKNNHGKRSYTQYGVNKKEHNVNGASLHITDKNSVNT